MPDIINISTSPRKTTWKKRPAFPPKTDVVEIEPEKYQFQAINLEGCFEELKMHKNLILSDENKYLEVTFFFQDDEVSMDYMKYLSQFGIDFISIFPLDIGCQIYFKISQYEKLAKYLSKVLKNFKDFSNKDSELTDKQIKLWRYFQLSTPEIKGLARVYIRPFNRIKLKIDFIEKIPQEQFEKFVLTSAKRAGIKNIEIYGEVLEIEEVSDSVRKTRNFIERIAGLDKVRAINLGDFVSMVESPLEGLKQDYSKVKILEVPENAPVIAVVDSGVQSGFLTDGFLLDGLDYTLENPLLGNAREDVVGHGTPVACEIVYGENIVDYFIKKDIDELLPLFKIFPVRVFSNEESNEVKYDEVFKIEGEFAKAIKKHNIKIINVSFNRTEPKNFNEIYLSKTASILDKFARTYGVLFVVSTGNIAREVLQKLTIKYKHLEFYERTDQVCSMTGSIEEKEINIAPPADLLSGITVGSCKQQKDKPVISSFSRSYKINMRGYRKKPDVVSVGGGDYPIDLGKSTPYFCDKSGRKPVVDKTFNYLNFEVGTSYSTPRVSRTLGVGLLKYPDLSVEALKGLFLHKVSRTNAALKKHGERSTRDGIEIQKGTCDFDDSFRGSGALISTDEDQFFSDSDDEVTVVIQGNIKSSEILTYDVPIAKMLGTGENKKLNKIKLTLSVCMLPIGRHGVKVRLSEANLFHISAMVHGSYLSPTYIKKLSNGRKMRDQCIDSKKEGIIVKWTCDYYQKENPSFSMQSRNYIKDDLNKLIGDSDNVKISVRGLCSKENINKKFALIFSIEDLGATGEIRNHINIEI